MTETASLPAQVAAAPTLEQVVAAVAELYPPALAESWDAVGLVSGVLDRPVRRILVAIDPVDVVVDEALAWGADLLLVHHPLLLRAVHSVAADDPKGALLTRLIEGRCALLTAHTNADAARPGVSDALAAALGVGDSQPLTDSSDSDPTELLVVYTPIEELDAVIDAAAAAGAGVVGDYRRCGFTSPGTGTFEVPVDGAPHVGTPGERCHVEEVRLEMSVVAARRRAVLAAVRSAHPYEEPAFFVLAAQASPVATGIGRVGELAVGTTLSEFVATVAHALPRSPGGVRVAGDPQRWVRRVAVCGGAGDSLLSAAASAGADVFVTADLRHHRASEALGPDQPALIDVSHWSSEWPWCPQVAALLPSVLESPDNVEIRVSNLVTDPWTAHARSDS